ncbi:cell division protein DivIVA [Clostridium carboxidivorans P7]|uniref:DivIVA family protein n=1 Tax=Clostridium carboxidivorans P7 TaxID=536227 RepID=C6Q1P9_9CLOT|nr:DivIVA domain-containing protein [Clostridium carboxidivorans]AKN33994.1 cell division protein DivIVA [Clostridium carboxidivorans P7]EET84591.1 DivIVA family protein [Clostridium carboxidivorans P7]EFG88132.1 DivIVA domain protein [Clostridium carboxidivorans P7]
MKITSMDITEKEFRKVLRGYSVEEVDEFLDKIAEEYEVLYKENSNYKEKLSGIQEKIEHYNKMENTIQNTLLLAQNASEQARENAKKESELILKNANDAAQKIIDKAHSDVIQITDEFERMKQEFCKFRTKFRSFMESQLEMFDDMEKEFVKNYNVGYESSENVNEPIKSEEIREKEIEIIPEKNSNSPIVPKYEDSKSDSEFYNNENELEEIKNFFVK